jgi:hypothetical protein
MHRQATRTVTAPDGTSWTVGPRWSSTKGVRLPRRQRHGRDDSRSFDPCDVGFLFDDFVAMLLAAIAFVVVVLLLVFVVWPLLALAVELLVAALLLVAGLIGRVVFGRPWTVEAKSSAGEVRTWQVRGYGAMRRTVREVSEQLAAGWEPAPADAVPALR